MALVGVFVFLLAPAPNCTTKPPVFVVSVAPSAKLVAAPSPAWRRRYAEKNEAIAAYARPKEKMEHRHPR